MFFPEYLARRLRRIETLRSMVRETILSAEDLILSLIQITEPTRPAPLSRMPSSA